ncbi:hypothetical protein H2198_009474 [Neophaeococcomyces mojaviensis]|uniref:Uncharacterized protein n=1 Tax=Neophaeococcomyces mojaviensis TaxID=3383035 RepID=A0ACC2ZUQ0_9EURO|nr:hypothetical protein H2198_009474 [Knufia sp. JES_112]
MPADESIHNIIIDLVNMLEGEKAINPYQSTTTSTTSRTPVPAGDEKHMLVICASETIKVLEALSPQAIHSSYEKDPTMRPVMRMIRHAFDTETPRAHTRFDMLKQALLGLLEPGTSAKDIHPCSEAWTEFQVNAEGTILSLPVPKRSDQVGTTWQCFPMSMPQQAALRLCTGAAESDELDKTTLLTQWTDTSTLTELFRQQIDQCQAEAQTLDCIFWKKALFQLHRQYPLSKPDLGSDDTLVLLQPYNHARAYKETRVQRCSVLEDEIGAYEKMYRHTRKLMTKFTAGLEMLRLKLWYASEVINSNVYLDARNIAAALNNMNTQTMRMTTNIDTSSRASLRPTSSRSAVSSIFGQRRDDTIELLKAPTEHGGPRKLADAQIEAVKRWFKKNDIDNFCLGEERLHRFCMEIQLVAKRLTGETMVESPVLWSSELFGRERSFYDVQLFGISSAPASTRPASVMSDSFSSTYPIVRPGMRSADSDTRSTISDERSSVRRGSVHSLFFRSLNPQLLTPELASSISSYGRTSSAATTTSEIFSNPSQSVTSASVYSRAPSMLHNTYTHRPSTSLREKRKFREQLQKGLICLLLSDLGCLVWSWGCETDAWVNNVQSNQTVAERLGKRMAAEVLFPSATRPRISDTRRRSTNGVSLTQMGSLDTDKAMEAAVMASNEDGEVGYVTGLRDILERISQHVDPVEKLQACHDFSTLAVEQLETRRLSAEFGWNVEQPTDNKPSRRKSLDSHQPTDSNSVADEFAHLALRDNGKPSDTEINRHIKRQLVILKPRTIFRDLQYIAVFTPKELLEKTPAGDAFVHLGMAALDYKNELCRSMVDVADQIVTADRIKRTVVMSSLLPKPEYSLSRAAEYWKIGAVEGNAVAMRELAGLYLMHPEMLPVVTLPLVPSGEIFKEEKMWQKKLESNNSRQALCLALHWMQQAAKKGDKIASKKLEERDGSLSRL